MRRPPRPLLALVLLLVAVPLVACDPADAGSASTSRSGPTGASQAPGVGTSAPAAVSELARLAVRPERDARSYRREAFGQRWADVDRNGCATRDDVLARDLRDVRRRGRCVVVAGTGVDFYTGEAFRFEKAQADRVQVDHVVALAEAWRSGASSWTEDRRRAFANDPRGLVLTSRSVNAGKGDQDAGTWAPASRAAACRFAVVVVQVKSAYGLAVDTREREGLLADLRACPSGTP